jgi:sec-independent protein translocase protein TatA
VIVVLIFGAKRLPDIGKGLGKSIREFKEETTNLHDEPVAKAEETKKES